MAQSADFLATLNPAQRQSVEHVSGPLLVVAGAGSGKTRALTFRIANLILTHRVDPENILAVTFTNKAAKEMKARIEKLFAEQEAQSQFGKPYDALPAAKQMKLRSHVYKTVTKDLWIGTFHALCARILRFDIEKYQDEMGHKWTRSFSIFDESDAQNTVKDIVINKLNLDKKRFEPRSVRFAISNAKNQGFTPEQFEREQPNFRGRTIATVYTEYQKVLAANNALDFDDLIRVPVQLFRQNESVLGYWHKRFRHILVDEYQDTNRTQYDLISMLVTNGEDQSTFNNWDQRSIFVVGDADQCLPPDTQVATPTGTRAIQDFRVGDEVVATAGGRSLQPGIITHVHQGYFKGEMWCVKVGDRVIKGTPHHILLARTVPLDNRYYVYLMYRADRGYRIGIITGKRQNDYGREEIGFKVRVAQEGADKLWVLKATDTKAEATYYEALLSAQYGLPTLIFHGPDRNLGLPDELIFKLFQELDTITNAQVLMRDFQLHPDFPHYRPQNGLRRQTLNLTMFGNVRRERVPVKSHHCIQWSSNREEIADRIKTAGFPIRAGKLPGTYRFETARSTYRDAVQVGTAVAAAGGLEIRRRAQINSVIYDLMPLSHLHPGMRLLVQQEDGLEEVEIEQVWQEAYDGPVYDLEVDQHHNYLANGILVHNSIYSFRAADFTILMDFQKDFGDGLADEDTRSMVKLEENYRSTENILQIANHIIENNTERIDKVLRPTRGRGETVYCYRADDETDEAQFVTGKIRALVTHNPDLNYGDFAILYRTNAQSRSFEEQLVRFDIPHKVVGGLRFYDRKEIKDIVSYLRAIANSADTVSIKRIINTPKRGVGKTTLDRLDAAAEQLGVPLWEIIQDETSVKTLAGRSAKGVLAFTELMKTWQAQAETALASTVIQGIVEESGYIADLRSQDTDEAENRIANVQELYNAAVQFESENENSNLLMFLANASLASDQDDQDNDEQVSLMTLHASKGLEFPVVFLVGMEQGLFPSFRSLDDPAAIEEERRLCYVGITRAEEMLFLSYANERRLYGYREPATPSMFLAELPEDLMLSNRSLPKRIGSTMREIKAETKAETKATRSPKPGDHFDDWQTGDRVIHPAFGEGSVVMVLGAGTKMCLAIKFAGQGKKIVDPKTTQLQRLEP
ncbi:MAG: UvrD-helicase domain-containing protein [Cyanothece sp. SIO2G6]|nr:UvrD-helicase domain-containing protein [Cyanothece sp. SIO2G6]